MFTRDRVPLSAAASILARVKIAAPSRSGDLRVWPLVALGAVAPPAGVAHVARAAAVAAGDARVEIPPGRGYRMLRAGVENGGDAALLLVAGDVPLAARPRWRVAATTLIAPRSSAEILVRSAPHDDARAAAIVCELAARSQDEQLGFVVALGDVVAGLEVVGRVGLFADVQASLLAPFAAATVATEMPRRFEATPPGSPEALLELTMTARCVAEPAPTGIGETLRLHGRGVVGRGLAQDGVAHLSVRWLGDDGEPLVKFP